VRTAASRDRIFTVAHCCCCCLQPAHLVEEGCPSVTATCAVFHIYCDATAAAAAAAVLFCLSARGGLAEMACSQ
jgi:hypothetical protein